MKRQDKIKNKNPQSLVPSPRSQLLGDILTIILCLAGALICIYLFQQDLNATLTRHGEEPIGTISFRYNTAQRRFIDRLIWDRLRNESPLYNGDIIRTADLSEAVMSFVFGDVVELYSNTLVQIFADKSGIRIDFARGGISVFASSDNGLVVLSQDKRIALDPGAVIRAFAENDGSLNNLTVNEGEAFLESIFGEDELVNLRAGLGLSFDQAGQVVNTPIAVPVYPANGIQIITEDDAAEIPFVWNNINYTGENADTRTRLEIASDRGFSRIVHSSDYNGNQFIYQLPEGMWFWRVLPAGSDARDIQYSRLSITQTAAPRLLSPFNEQEITYNNRAPSVRFQWTASPNAVSYNLVVANNQSFQNPAVRVQVRAGGGADGGNESYSTSALTEGTWYWQVTPVYGRDAVRAGDSAQDTASVIQSFKLSRVTALAAPVLTAPANNAAVNVEFGARDILFSWRKNNEAASYTLRVSSDINMASPVIEHTTQDTFFRYIANREDSGSDTMLTSGTWYWSVYYTSHNGGVSPVSQTRTLNAVQGEFIQRLVFPPDDYTIAVNFLEDNQFTWKTNLQNNFFQVSRSSDFSDIIINDFAPAERYPVRNLAAGEYFWRINGNTRESQVTSSARRFKITDSLPPPSLFSPDSGVSAQTGNIVVRQGHRVNFTWQPIEGAEYYLFKVFRGDSTAPILETTVYTTSTSVNMDNYEDGYYTWSVQGLAKASPESSRRTGLSAAQEVNVRQLRPVLLEHPRDGFQYTGIRASRTPDMARWFSQEQTINTQFILASDSRMRDIVYQFSVTERNFTLPRLSEGDYYWIVRAETIEGYDITSEPAHFSVLPITRLPAPLNRIPEDRHTITAQMIAASRSVNFSWDAVPGANGYILSVFQGTGRSRSTIIESQVITGTTYSIEDIRLLGRGTFYWQAEAVFVLEDGFIEQRGILQENRLVIDIPAPRQVRTRDSGVLYGM